MGLKILSCGAGMQSSALHLMACENAMARHAGKLLPWPAVPIYDVSIFCDLGFEPPWVMNQVKFLEDAGRSCGIPFVILPSPLYQDFINNFGERRTISVPWWTIRDDGHKSKMPRNCTIDYKVQIIAKYVKWTLLGYKKWQRLNPADVKAHEMHMGFSYEERRRCRENSNPLFVNHFPLVEMKMTRADNYAYIKDVWGLETRASACTFCPFHRNYFFMYLKEHEPEQYQQLLGVDHLLETKNPKPPMDSDLYISRSRKRIADLTEQDCCDAECFLYQGKEIWNGF